MGYFSVSRDRRAALGAAAGTGRESFGGWIVMSKKSLCFGGSLQSSAPSTWRGSFCLSVGLNVCRYRGSAFTGSRAPSAASLCQQSRRCVLQEASHS